MSNYYCLMTAAPAITMEGSKTGITYDSFRKQCDEALTEADSKLLSYSYLKLDCQNLVKLLKDDQAVLKSTGIYTKEELLKLIDEAENSVFEVEGFPPFLIDFIRNSYQPNKDKEGYFADDAVMQSYYQYAMTCPNKMMAAWFELNFNLTNILTAMIAQRYGWDVKNYVLGGNDISDMLKTNKAKDFGLSKIYDFTSELMKIVETDDPVEKEKKLDALKWIWLDDKTFFDPFNIEAVFAYLSKLELQQRWQQLDYEKGKETFKQIIEDLRSSAKVPDEFTHA